MNCCGGNALGQSAFALMHPAPSRSREIGPAPATGRNHPAGHIGPLRDPFLALQTGLALVTDTAIVADVIPRRRFWHRWVTRFLQPEMLFLPNARDRKHGATWWILPPQLVQRYLGVLGFEDTTLTYHSQLFEGSRRLLYTLVARRTKAAPILARDAPVASVAA